MKPPSRTLTIVAVGVLWLDALVLVAGGVVLHRPWVIVAGVGCALAALLVIAGWRRYRRILVELDAARREMKQEVQAIRDLLHSRQLHG